MRKTANTQIMAALGWGVLLGALSVPGMARAQDAKEGCRDCVTQNGDSLFSRIPYLSRLFKNVEAASCPECCDEALKVGEDFVERIGVDFDFSPEATFGIQVVEFCPAPGACGRATANTAKARTLCLACDDGACDIDEECVAEGDEGLQQRLLNLTVQAAVLGNLSELQSELVATRLELSEELAKAKVEHFEELLKLAVENAQLKAKLEFQSEREALQSQIAELTIHSVSLQSQVAIKVQVMEAQLVAQSLRHEVDLLAKEKEHLEARVADLEGQKRNSDASSSEASVANRRRGATSTK